MTSAPSASALTAVLRCRGNILASRPPAATGGCPAERTGSNRARPPGDRGALVGGRGGGGGGLSVAYEPPRVGGTVSRGQDSRESHKFCHSKLSQSAAVRRVQPEPARQRARRPASGRPRTDTCSQIIQKIRRETCAVCERVFGETPGEFPVLKVAATCPRLRKRAGRTPPLVSSCWPLTALVSEFMCLKLAVLWRSSSSPRDALRQQSIRHNALQANGQPHNPTDLSSSKDTSGSGQMIPGDRPD